ncbi:MAG: ribbon-helix-helix protein, CopG family [Pseudomonadota bacterium]|nr:ribbon-helix-helix protein, CopG family [Pseudomonadota bacterium]
MAKVEKVTVALTPEMATLVRQVVEAGEYASTSEVIRDALREWKLRRAERARGQGEADLSEDEEDLANALEALDEPDGASWTDIKTKYGL